MEWLLCTQDNMFEVKLRDTDCGKWIRRRRIHRRTLRNDHLRGWGLNESERMTIVEISWGTTDSGKYHSGG